MAALPSDVEAMEPPHAVHRACQTWAGTLAQAEHGLEDVPTMLRQRGQYTLAQVRSVSTNTAGPAQYPALNGSPIHGPNSLYGRAPNAYA